MEITEKNKCEMKIETVYERPHMNVRDKEPEHIQHYNIILIIILFYCGKRKGNLFKAKSVIGGQSNKYRKRTKETEIDEKNEINKTNCEKSDFAIDSGFTVIVLTSHHHQFIVEWNIFFSLRYIKANFYFIFAPNKSELNIFVE